MRLFDEQAPARSTPDQGFNPRTRLALAASPAVLASMLALQPQIVCAQAFQGTATPVLGNFQRFGQGPSETILINSDQVTINWTPTDTATSANAINFLPAGNIVNFTGGSGLQSGTYTVLNRVIAADPTRTIVFNGTVTSDPGGRIWFYAPGGLLLSNTARFNVGSLLLTANDPVGAAAGQRFLSNTNQFRLAAAAGSTARVDIVPGGAVVANNGSRDA